MTNNYRGIYLGGADNNTLAGNNAWNNYRGIDLATSYYNTLTNNTVWDSTQYGIYLTSSYYNNLTGNNATNSTQYGICLSWSDNNTLTGNNAGNNNDGGFYLWLSNNNNLTSNNATDNDYGIYLDSSGNSNITSNNASNNTNDGIRLESASNTNLTGNNVWNNTLNGIRLRFSDSNNLTGNNAWNNTCGIHLISSDNNTLTNNNAWNNTDEGIYLSSSGNNTISSNTVYNNSVGINLASSFNNTIYNNYFNNTLNARNNGNNTWNITKTSGTNIVGGLHLGGNYWSDYAGRDLDGDGLGDTLLPYNCTGNITSGGDYHPLTIGVVVIPTTGLVTTESGGSDTFVVMLNNEPTAPVTVGLSSSDTTEGTVSPTVVTFTNLTWNITQTVTVTGVDDSILDGDIAYHIITAPAVSADADYNGSDALDVNVTNFDDELLYIAAGAAGGGGAAPRAPEPASFSASYLQISPQQVNPNQPVTISINIANIGGEGGSHTVTLYINGNAEQSQTVSLAPGAAKNVVFTVTRAAPGTYIVTVEGQSGQFVVVAGGAGGGGGILGGGGAGGAGGLGTGGLIAIVVVVLALIVGLIFLRRSREGA